MLWEVLSTDSPRWRPAPLASLILLAALRQRWGGAARPTRGAALDEFAVFGDDADLAGDFPQIEADEVHS